MRRPSIRRCEDRLIDAVYRLNGDPILTGPTPPGLRTNAAISAAVQSLLIEKRQQKSSPAAGTDWANAVCPRLGVA